MSLLTMISGSGQNAAILCGIRAPTAIINSSDPNVPLLLACAQQEGRELARRHDWQTLKVDYTTSTTATTLQSAFPADFDRLLHDGEFWNQSINQKYSKATDLQWGRLNGLDFTASSTAGWWRISGGRLSILPAPTAGQTLAYPYISKNWCQSSGGTAQSAWAADTDTGVIDESLMVLGIVWRYKKMKGFDYAEDMATYERAVEIAASRDGGGTESILLRRAGSSAEPFSWPGTVTP